MMVKTFSDFGHLPDKAGKPKGMKFNTHCCGSEAAKIIHGPYSAFHFGPVPSNRRNEQEAQSEKGAFAKRDASAPLLGREAKTTCGKVTDGGGTSARCITPRREIGGR